MLDILKTGTKRARARSAARGRRRAEIERSAGWAARRKTKRVFGRPLTPAETVRKIVADVRRDGDKALFRYTRLLDGVRLTARSVRVSGREFERAHRAAPRKFLAAVRLATRNIRAYQKRLMPRMLEIGRRRGLLTGTLWRAVESAGCYIPGGTASYPSSVPMNVVPAQVAGVRRIILAMPPGAHGAGNPLTLAAARELGMTEVYRIGGAQAIAALAFGTRSVPRVDKITGPGNIYVTLAKREVYGMVDIDGLFGPSEVLVIADGRADAELVAADMLAQAEHDPLASAVLLTDSAKLARAAREALLRRLDDSPRRVIAAEALGRWGLILVTRSLREAAEVADEIAPEHLELMTREPMKLLPHLRNAGAIFLGADAPEALGDYVAGPSHTLPTGGTARFASGLSALTFLKRTSLVGATPAALKRLAPAILELSLADGLPAHAESVKARMKKKR